MLILVKSYVFNPSMWRAMGCFPPRLFRSIQFLPQFVNCVCGSMHERMALEIFTFSLWSRLGHRVTAFIFPALFTSGFFLFLHPNFGYFVSFPYLCTSFFECFSFWYLLIHYSSYYFSIFFLLPSYCLFAVGIIFLLPTSVAHFLFSVTQSHRRWLLPGLTQ